ncbi:hypothetical protein V6U90_19965 [Micromonospora sp. CPCC 206060]
MGVTAGDRRAGPGQLIRTVGLLLRLVGLLTAALVRGRPANPTRHPVPS